MRVAAQEGIRRPVSAKLSEVHRHPRVLLACSGCQDLADQPALTAAVTDPGRAAARRAFGATTTTRTIDIAAIEAAWLTRAPDRARRSASA